MRLASLLALCLALAGPAVSQTVYSNGPINGNADGWYVNFGVIVSDTFTVTNNNTTITGGSFGMWLYPNDTLLNAQLSITSDESSGSTYFDKTVWFTTGACASNQYGLNVCVENTTFNGPTLNAGTYWINLQNANVPSGNPVYWDENSGPSQASNNDVGSIPSESFTLLGTSSTTTSSTTTTTTSVPEPGSIMLLGSGILGLASLVRHKLF